MGEPSGIVPRANDCTPQMGQNLCLMLCLLNKYSVSSSSLPAVSSNAVGGTNVDPDERPGSSRHLHRLGDLLRGRIDDRHRAVAQEHTDLGRLRGSGEDDVLGYHDYHIQLSAYS